MGLIVERAKQKLRHNNVSSIEPSLRGRRLKRNIIGNPPVRCVNWFVAILHGVPIGSDFSGPLKYRHSHQRRLATAAWGELSLSAEARSDLDASSRKGPTILPTASAASAKVSWLRWA